MATENHDHFPPGPPGVGSNILKQMAWGISVQRDMFGAMADWLGRYGDLVHFEIGGVHAFIVTRPEHLHEVTTTQADKFLKGDDYTHPERGLAYFLGNGLIITDGEFWKRQRRLVAPALHAKRVEAYADTMVDFTLRHLDSWQDGAVLDVDASMMTLTSSIVAKTLFNADVLGDAKAVGDAMTVLQHASSSLDMIPKRIPTPKHLRERRALQALDAVVYRIINEWRRQNVDRGDLLSMLLLARDDDGEPMSDKQVRDEAMTLFLAGHETTANALNWTWYLLSQNPDVERRLHDELDSVLQGQPPTLADLKRLPYTDMVVKESMRLYPPAWGFGRKAAVDTQLGGYDIPAGSALNCGVIHVHRDPRWWPNPMRFDPDRFDPGREQSIQKFAYMPFGGGPRICIGNTFAMMEARLLLATMASRYRLLLPLGTHIKPEPLITLRPKGGLRMRLQRRHPLH